MKERFASQAGRNRPGPGVVRRAGVGDHGTVKRLLPALATLLWSGLAAAGSPGAPEPRQPVMTAVPTDPGAGSSTAVHWTVYVDGFLDAGAAARLAAVIEQRRVLRAVVVFNSPGGSLIEAMDIGRLLRAHGFEALVGRRRPDDGGPAAGVCYSACPFALAGGTSRALVEGSVIGIHRAANRQPVPDEAAFQQRVWDDAADYLVEMGVSDGLLAAMVRVPHDTIRRLTPEEAAGLNVLTE